MNPTPYELVTQRVPLPFEFWDLQKQAVNDVIAPLARSGVYAEVGTGKTGMSTVGAIYHMLTGVADFYIVTVPPILINQWCRWFAKLPGVSAVAYQGTPRERAQIPIVGHDAGTGEKIPLHDFVVMSLDIFKRDQERLLADCAGMTVGGIVDEATSVKNVESANHRRVRDFFTGRPLMLLTGRPLATPEDGYAYVRLLTGNQIYRSKKIFDSVHVESRDFFGTVEKWQNLEVLQKNMQVNAVTLRKVDVLPDLPQPIYEPIFYKLSKEHQAFYDRLAEEQVIELESGGKIDATSVSKLFNCMQQVVLNWSHFTENPDNVPAGFELMDELLEELGAGKPDGRKAIVFANYRMTMATMAKRYEHLGMAIINGDTPKGARDRLVQEFIDDWRKGALGIQPRSGGYGLDGLQYVTNDVLFAECPTSPIDFAQSVGRVYRPGQKNQPNIRIAVAENTIQVRLHRLLLSHDELTTYVQGGGVSLREALRGH